MKIYNLGSLNIDYVYQVDHFVSAGETLSSDQMTVFPGGKGLNQSIALARAGATVIHGAILGSDGQFLIDTLLASGVDTDRIRRTDGSCGHAIIQVDRNGQNCILLFPGSNHKLDRNYIHQFLSDAEPDDILLLQYETNALDIIFEIAGEKKMQIVFNPSPFHTDILKLPLEQVTWWFCNEIEGEALFGSSDPMEIADNFARQFPDSNLILTLGSQGSLFRHAETQIGQAAYETEVVDTTAAGDTFTGYFMAMIAQGKGIEEALKIASRAAAISVSRNGASESIPFINELSKDGK